MATTISTARYAPISTNDGIWVRWASDRITTNTVTGATFSDAVWSSWTQTNSITSSSVTMDGIWRAWQRVVASNAELAARQQLLREQTARAQRVRAEAARAEEERTAAQARARKLLVEHLTPEQRETYERHRYFDLELQGKRYRIHHGTHGNVRLLDERGATRESYCVQPDGVPDEDAMLAQALCLRLNPEEFFRKANRRVWAP